MSVEAIERATPRRPIASTSRATQIVERVAAKHQFTVAFVLCAKRDRFAVAARAEAAHELKRQLDWSLRRIGDHIGCTHENVRQLLTCHKMNTERNARCLPPIDLNALNALEGCELKQRVADAEERAAYAEAELARLTGATLALTLAEALGLTHQMRCAITLAIVAEAYPRVVLGSELIEHYDAACERLAYGFRRGANSHLMTKNVTNLREHFEANGWPAPLLAHDAMTRTISGARRLTDDAATFLHERFDVPRRSQIEAGVEQRSLRVRAVTVRCR